MIASRQFDMRQVKVFEDGQLTASSIRFLQTRNGRKKQAMENIQRIAQKAIGSQPAAATLESTSNLWLELQDERKLQSVYDALSTRQRLMMRLLQDSAKQRGLPPYDKIDLLITLKSWQPILEDLPDYALEHCFIQAVRWHPQRHSHSPFQAAEVAQIWSEASESTRQKLFEASGVKALVAGICEWCNGFGKMRVKIIFWLCKNTRTMFKRELVGQEH
jgi:hypothetical protein